MHTMDNWTYMIYFNALGWTDLSRCVLNNSCASSSASMFNFFLFNFFVEWKAFSNNAITE